MTNTVTLIVTRKARVVVDVEKQRVREVNWDLDFDAKAEFIPHSAGEQNAIEVLKREREWLR
jgi:hypothetical protein